MRTSPPQPLERSTHSRDEIIARLRASVDANKYPLTFAESQKIYKENPILENNTNCFSYSTGIYVPLRKGLSYGLFNPGTISNPEKFSAATIMTELFTTEELFGGYLEDLKFFGFSTTLARDAMESIFMVRKVDGLVSGFHFIRREQDGTYSEKGSWERPPYQITSPDDSYCRYYQTVDSVRFEKSIKKSTFFLSGTTPILPEK